MAFGCNYLPVSALLAPRYSAHALWRGFAGVMTKFPTRLRTTNMPNTISPQAVHHIALPTRNPEIAADFYVGVVGMQRIERPAFSFAGAWLYHSPGNIQIHLICFHFQTIVCLYCALEYSRSRVHVFASVAFCGNSASKAGSAGGRVVSYCRPAVVSPFVLCSFSPFGRQTR